MRRPPREFKPASFGLEGRLLLTVPSSPYTSPMDVSPGDDFVGFGGPTVSDMPLVLLQPDGSRTVNVYRDVRRPRDGSPIPPLQVVVATDPSSPAVGVNVGAVYQTITFDSNHFDADVTIPISAAAPNPGEVDTTLTITPVNPPPNVKIGFPLHLRILASKDVLPPQIVSEQGTPQGIVVTFSKPMDPAGASNVNNYVVHATPHSSGGGDVGLGIHTLGSFLSALFGKHSSPPPPQPVRIRSARYDPATQAVTLVPNRALNYKAYFISVTERPPAKVAGRRGHPSNAGPRLTDLQGMPLDIVGMPMVTS